MDQGKAIAALAEKLVQLEGQLLATQVAVRGLINAHPDPEAAEQAVQLQIERFVASGLATPDIGDRFLRAMEAAKRRVLPDDQDRSNWPQSPAKP